MKVVYNETNSQAYDNLFKKATERLRTQNILSETQVVDSLASYFKYLSELEKYDPSFMRIPLEEQRFFIHLNTRTIEPAEGFDKPNDKNGWIIGVKDDHKAEILFFEVDRFYDAVDLGICFPHRDENSQFDYHGQTYIQWKLGKKDSAGWGGLDPVQWVEITEKKIYFGWEVSSNVLSEPGDLTFSVRFEYRQNLNPKNNKAPDLESPSLFSLNTKELQCTIAPNLFDQFTNSNIAGVNGLVEEEDTTDSAILRPRFSGIYNNIEGPQASIRTNLPRTMNLDENNEALLQVEAYSIPDGKELLFKWFDLWKNEGENRTIHEGSSYYTAEEPGAYMVSIGNNYEEGKVRWIDSNTCIIPRPSNLTISNYEDIDIYQYNDGSTSISIKFDREENEALVKNQGEISYDIQQQDPDDINTYNTVDTLYPEDSSLETFHFIYTPDDTNAGIYRIKINNYHNNQTKEFFSPVFTIKNKPVTPTEVTIIEDSAQDGVITLKANVTMPNGTKNDLYYKWYEMTEIENPNAILNPDAKFEAGNNMYTVKNNNKYSKLYVKCVVRQTVYADTNIPDKIFTGDAKASDDYEIIKE